MDDIEQAIDKELMKLNLHPSENDLESDDDNFTVLDENLHAEDELPDSVLTYVKASRNRMNGFEQLILEDVEEKDVSSQNPSHLNHNDNPTNEPASDFIDDPIKWKERVISELVEQTGHLKDIVPQNAQQEILNMSGMEDDVSAESELQDSLEWRELEKKLKKEEEQKLAAREIERELHLNSEREEEERRRRGLMKFEEELKRIEEATLNVGVKNEVHHTEDFQLELDKQQMLISKLEEQMEEEKQAFEKAQEEERMRTQKLHCISATKIQAAFRGTLVRRWRETELRRKKEEERRLEEEKREWEKVKKEREQERNRIEEEKRAQREEMERRRADYERAKEQERHRLEKEQRLEQQKRKEEEDGKRKKMQKENNVTSVKDYCRRQEEDVDKKNKEKERMKMERSSQVKDECKREEEIGELENKENELNVRKTEDNNKRIRHEKKMENDRIMMKKQEKTKSINTEDTERSDDTRPHTKSDEGKTKKHEEGKTVKSSGELDSQVNLSQSRKSIKVTKTPTESPMNVHQGLSSDFGISPGGSSSVADHLSVEGSTVLTQQASGLTPVAPEMDTRGHHNTTAFELVEKELRLEQQKRKEEEDGKRKQMQKENNVTSVKDDCRRHEEDVDKKNKEKERMKMERSSQVKDECKREEEIGELENKENELNVRKTEDNNKRIRHEKKMENDRIMMKKQEKTKSINTEDTERSDDTRPHTKSDEGKFKKHEEGKTVESSGELDSQVNLSQSRKSIKVTKTPTESPMNVHQGLSRDFGISPGGSSSVADHLSVEGSTVLTVQASGLAPVAPEMDTRGHHNTTAFELEDHKLKSQESILICLPDITEQKRLAWMMSCTPWSKLSLQNKRKGFSAQQQSQKRGPRKRRVPSLPPLSVDTILKTGHWSSLKQVTTVTLEDLPGCSLSTLCECNKLQTLTLRRCGLTSLDGLNQCAQIRYIDVQENSITYVDCGGLANLQVLLLGRNQLMNIHGLDGAENLQILQLSHNNISRISGLGPLKMLLRLSVDHNQLLSMRGLNEIYTLLHLDCSYNHLSHVEGLENCALLNTLDLRGNSLTELPVLQNHVLLRDLYLDDNLLSSLDNLESYWLPLLQNLSVAHNSLIHLIPLSDLVSLRMLDASHNCLSELKNVCLNLQECTSLQELNLTGNPLQQKSNWRSLLLETVPGLIKLNNEQTAAAAVPRKYPEQQWSFQALCQAQQEQRDSLFQQQKMEISSAPSQHDAQLLAIGHQADLFRLTVDQRYAHEYGDSCVTEDPTLVAAANSSYSKASLSHGQNTDMHLRDSLDWRKHLELRSADCIQTQSEKEPVQAMNLKIAAAVAIQRCWRRRCAMRRCEGLPSLIEKTNTKSHLHKVENIFTGGPEMKRAAVVIQAAWRGCVLRKKLARALAAAQITESDEDLEEVDMDEFIFDEKGLEKDWISLDSKALPARMMPFSEQLPLPKSPLPLLNQGSPKTLSVFPLQPKHAWSDNEGAACSEQSLTPHLSSRSSLKTRTLSEESEKILKEWGITNESTALLMMKRANKLKGKKQKQKGLYDPNLRLALFRSHRNQYVSKEPQRLTRPTFKDNVKVQQAVNEVHKLPKAEEKQSHKERTYQWLHTQAVHPDTNSAGTGRDNFLPDIGQDILNGARVQLMAIGDRDSGDSGARFWTDSTSVPPPFKKHTQPRRYSAENTKTEAPSLPRVNSAPIRNERISFRDNPVRHSGGWGGGKKRTKLNK